MIQHLKGSTSSNLMPKDVEEALNAEGWKVPMEKGRDTVVIYIYIYILMYSHSFGGI